MVGKRGKYVAYLFLIIIMPIALIGSAIAISFTYPDVPVIAYAALVIGIVLLLFNKKITRNFNALVYEMEHDEFGNRRNMEDVTMLSKKERIAIDKQRIADIERLVGKNVLKAHTKAGSINPEKDMEALIGLSKVKEQMRLISARMEFDRDLKKGKQRKDNLNNHHMCFIGSPGTGKTTVARIMTGFLYKNFFIKRNYLLEIDANFLKGTTDADSSLKTEIIIDYAKNGVLFIDEAYALFNDRQGIAAISTLIKRMEDDRDGFVLIIAGYSEEIKRLLDSNPGFASRFSTVIEFPDYSTEELIDIFQKMVNGYNLCVSSDAINVFREKVNEQRRLYSNRKRFGNGRLVRNITDAAISKHALRVKTENISDKAERYIINGEDLK